MKYALLTAVLFASVACQKGRPAEPAPSPATAEATPAVTATIPADSKWAGSRIAWQSAEAGLAQARREGRPVMMVVKTEWCPRCKEYSALFRDQAVEKAAKDFVMVLVDGDRDPEAARFAPDGTYIPRTFFLTPEGEIEPSLHGPHPRYRYFLNGARPELVTDMMARARDALGG